MSLIPPRQRDGGWRSMSHALSAALQTHIDSRKVLDKRMRKALACLRLLRREYGGTNVQAIIDASGVLKPARGGTKDGV